MADNNKHNILYFEGSSMRVLHNTMDEWQKENEKRFLSMSVNKDGDSYCCIALTNPSEVVIVSGSDYSIYKNQAMVTDHKLHTT